MFLAGGERVEGSEEEDSVPSQACRKNGRLVWLGVRSWKCYAMCICYVMLICLLDIMSVGALT